MIVASASAAFAQSHKDVILLGHLLVCAKSVNLHTCTVLMGTDLVRSLNNRLEYNRRRCAAQADASLQHFD